MVADFGSFYDFPRFVNSMLEELDDPAWTLKTKVHFPPLNISEGEEAVIIKALVPGADIGDIELTLNDNILGLKGEIPSKQGKYHRQERPTGVFNRVIQLNVPIDPEKVRAVMKDGVLTIILPKMISSRPHTITIQPR